MSELNDILIAGTLSTYGVTTTPGICDAVRTYIALLLRWNQRISLTTVTEPAEILRFHFGESMFASFQEKLKKGRLADVGSGAGFPGVPIKMVSPDLDVFLIESNVKKAAFLAEVIRSLRMDGIAVFCGRAEEFTNSVEKFDFITARAIGQHADLLSWAKGSVATAGRLILWLGDEGTTEILANQDWRWGEAHLIPGSKRRRLIAGSPAT